MVGSPGLTAASLRAVDHVTYTGTLTPNGTTYRLGGGGGTLTIVNANALTGAGKSLVINGNVTLPTANAFDAGTTLNTGTLAIGDNNCLGSGSLIVSGGGIASDSETARTLANPATIATDVTLGDPVNSGELTFTGPASLGTVNRVITLNSEAELAGSISGAGGALTKAGTSTLTLSGANSQPRFHHGPAALRPHHRRLRQAGAEHDRNHRLRWHPERQHQRVVDPGRRNDLRPV